MFADIALAACLSLGLLSSVRLATLAIASARASVATERTPHA